MFQSARPFRGVFVFGIRSSLLALGLMVTASAMAQPANWPQFRGPNGSGVNEQATPPVHFGPKTNLLWKVPIPAGLSSPVVWNDRLFLTAHTSNELCTLAFDTRTGQELWRRPSPATQIEKCHPFSSPAASTPCTDGHRVYVYFGSFGVLAYDFSGKEVWRRPFDTLLTLYGTASSPILAGAQVILQRDGDNTNAQLVALAPETGKTLWEAARPMAGASYSTPMVWRRQGAEELMIQGKGRLSAYPLSGGEPIWWVRGWGFAAITTPVAGENMLFAGGSGMGDPAEPKDPLFNWAKLISDYDANRDGNLELTELPESVVWHIRKEIPADVPGNSFAFRELLEFFTDQNKDKVVTQAEWEASEAYAEDKFNADRFVGIKPGARHDGTDSHVVWETTRGLSDMPSALFYRGRLYVLRDGGMISAFEPKSGDRITDRQRLGIGGQMVASPVAANGHLYIVNEAGTFAVVKPGDPLEVVAVNRLGENVRSTPAIAGNTLFVRTRQHLWAFAR